MCRQRESLKTKEEAASLNMVSSRNKVEKLASELAFLKSMEADAQKTAEAVSHEVSLLKAQVFDLEKTLEISVKEAAAVKEQLSQETAKVREEKSLICDLSSLVS